MKINVITSGGGQWGTLSDMREVHPLAALIDHTALGVEVDGRRVDLLCDEAIEHGFASVCVQPLWVERAVGRLRDEAPKVCTVVGFPMGQSLAASKADEAQRLAGLGAQEIDMVVAWGALVRGEYSAVGEEIRRVARAAPACVIKVILESAGLTTEALVAGCKLAVEGGAHFVKTSTGFGPGGASLAAVRTMRETVGAQFGVKASGGIRDRSAALQMVEAGASRLGCSAGLQIVGQL